VKPQDELSLFSQSDPSHFSHEISGRFVAANFGNFMMYAAASLRVEGDERFTLRQGVYDGSRISLRVYCGGEDGVMGSLEARRVAEGDRASFW
jgi:hypothetical protein